MTNRFATLSLLLAVGLVACGSKDGGSSGSSGSSSPKGSAAPAGSSAPKSGGSGTADLAALGVTLDTFSEDAPALTEVTAGSNWMVTGTKGGAPFGLGVEIAKEAEAKMTAEDDKKLTTDSGINPKDFKSEDITDGWWVTSHNSASPTVEMYNVTYQQKIGEKTFRCTGTGTSEAQQEAILKACKTLKAK